MSVSSPMVSVVIPVFNGADSVKRAVRSVLDQTAKDVEVILVDDASTDETATIAFDDPRVRVLRLPRNVGPAAARNAGFAESRGEYVAVLDSDDEWLPRKLERQLEALGEHEFALCGYREITASGNREIVPPAHEDWRRRLHWRSGIAAGSVPLARRRFLEGRVQDERMRLLEDWDWLLRLCQEANPACVPEALVIKHEADRRPRPEVAEECTRLFLEKHDRDILRDGWRHRRWVRAKHFERLAETCYRARAFRRGSGWLLRSFAENPLQNPLRLGALAAAPIDWATGGSIIERASAFKNWLNPRRGTVKRRFGDRRQRR